MCLKKGTFLLKLAIRGYKHNRPVAIKLGQPDALVEINVVKLNARGLGAPVRALALLLEATTFRRLG